MTHLINPSLFVSVPEKYSPRQGRRELGRIGFLNKPDEVGFPVGVLGKFSFIKVSYRGGGGGKWGRNLDLTGFSTRVSLYWYLKFVQNVGLTG